MRGSLVIGEIRGIKIEINASWLIVFGLVTFMLATSFFPANYPDWEPAINWAIGAILAVSLFVSVLLHELSHSLVAIRNGIPVKKITLFIFGGVAQIEKEPDDPLTEFKVAIAGPAMSVFLALLFSALAALGEAAALSQYLVVPLAYLSMVNTVLAVFNLVPAFPLDGGRVLRSLIWYLKGDLKLATSISSAVGSFFGYFLIFSGIFVALNGQLISGIWFIFIGWFITQASQTSYEQVRVNDLFKKIKVRSFMKEDVVPVDYHITLRELVDNYFYRYKYASFPVRRMDSWAGIVTINDIKAIPRDQWQERLVIEVTRELTEDMQVSPDQTVSSTLEKLAKNGVGRVLVLDDEENLLGIVSNTDVLNYIRIHTQLE